MVMIMMEERLPRRRVVDERLRLLRTRMRMCMRMPMRVRVRMRVCTRVCMRVPIPMQTRMPRQLRMRVCMRVCLRVPIPMQTRMPRQLRTRLRAASAIERQDGSRHDARSHLAPSTSGHKLEVMAQVVARAEAVQVACRRRRGPLRGDFRPGFCPFLRTTANESDVVLVTICIAVSGRTRPRPSPHDRTNFGSCKGRIIDRVVLLSRFPYLRFLGLLQFVRTGFRRRRLPGCWNGLPRCWDGLQGRWDGH